MGFLDIDNLNNISMLSIYVRQFGVLAPLIAFFLFVIQAALPVFPYIILATVGGILFGFEKGVILSWSGALVGACLAYWICRLVGSEWVIEKIRSHFGYDLRTMDSELAFWSIVVARVIPVVPTPLINAVAALSGVSFWNFFFSSALGKIPSAVLYTGLGICLFNTKDIKLALLILLIIIALAIVGRVMSKKKDHFFTNSTE